MKDEIKRLYKEWQTENPSVTRPHIFFEEWLDANYKEPDNNEISELQSTCKSQKKALDIYANVTMPSVEKTISDLKAENERLREALVIIEHADLNDYYIIADVIKQALQYSTTDKK